MAKYTQKELASLGLTPMLPKHVGIIMDGNGRWAKQRMLPRTLGHRAAMDKLRGTIRLTSDLNIEALSLYAFSTENWSRPEEEVSALFDLLVEYFTRELDELHKNGVCIRILGDISAFPSAVREAVTRAHVKTRENTGLKLNIALNYGSRAELVRAAQSLCESALRGELRPKEIDEAALFDRLYTYGLPELDLVIRTGGEKRLSNFMLLQAAYAELYFTDTYWPDFSEKKYIEALKEYQLRDRRYGTVK
ncbi:MAG: isoprenyl transferase [Clostridiaceae bacterium]|nr:isoprenyl transferase [Eubacteriales bacterium]